MRAAGGGGGSWSPCISSGCEKEQKRKLSSQEKWRLSGGNPEARPNSQPGGLQALSQEQRSTEQGTQGDLTPMGSLEARHPQILLRRVRGVGGGWWEGLLV